MASFRLALLLLRLFISKVLWKPDAKALSFVRFTAVDVWTVRMMLPLPNNAIAEGVAKHHPGVLDTAITVFRPAANGAGGVSSRGTHDSFPLFFEVVLFAIGFDQF